MSEPASPEEPAKTNPGLLTRARVLLRWSRRILFQELPAEEAKEVRRSVEEEGRFTER
jgi:hypothetical protein